MLHTKVRREWGSLSPEERAGVSSAASSALGQTAGTPLVSRRVCLVLAAAGARSAPPEAAQFVRQALSLAAGGGANLPVSLTLLQALADEADEAPPGRRAALLAPLAPALPEVLALCEQVLGARAAPHADVLRCALAWLRLHPDAPGGGAAAGGFLLLSPPALARSAPTLLATARACMGSEDDADAAAGTDLVAELHAVSNPRDADDAEAAAVADTIAALLALRARAAAPDGEAVARCVACSHVPLSFLDLTRPAPSCRSAIARVATALAERHLPQLCRGEGQWLLLTQLMFDTVAGRCGGHEHVCSHT
jgi:hypothetical protein